ncbi:hypothetical protein KIH87_04520 [Paraneptunicella aestuarii]|uniref:hypothetical protein n=1 Tax=Paraneptunicella aestuarii TaxID=2831148 RepID=UPI001E53DD2A|nr:hypothetical protein [Paraneptunicella aestuarii]UAA39628.1 hypothetical protein KIH87_04520 [Paraneptunicella aestuarii]
MFDYAVGFVIDNVWVLVYLIAGFYGFYTKRLYRPFLHTIFTLAITFGLSRIIYSQFLLPLDNLYQFYYLYWAAACGAIVLILAIDHHLSGFVYHWPLKLTMGLLLIAMSLHIAVHIDRNIVALNGALEPNLHLKDAWWLWAVRNIFVSLDNVLILASLLFPYKAFRSSEDIYRIPVSVMQMDKVCDRVESLEKMLMTMPNGLNKAHAFQCVNSARTLLNLWGSGGEDRSHIYSANLLCDRARDLAIYTEKALEKRLKAESEGRVKLD